MSRKIRAAAASAPAPSLATPPPQAPPLFASLPQEAPAWGVSMLVHFIVLLALALIVQAPPRLAEQPLAIVAEGREAAETEAAFEVASPDTEPVLEAPAGEIELTEMVPLEPVEVAGVAADPEAAPLAVELSDLSAESAISSDLLETVGALGGEAGGLGGRINPQRRDQLVASGGGNPQSEAAVEAALKWFVQHQLPDGGWSLDLVSCPACKGQCSHSGEPARSKDRCGATALALLPFLGRGYTHKEGPYKRQIDAGLGFLAGMTLKGQGQAYGEGGSMYSQGLAAIVLCEGYAMSQDRRLQAPAQLALNFIMAAQDPVGGGWRYSPRQPGDTSAVGWQLMALKSGHMAYLQVSPLTLKKTSAFLDSVQGNEGATYGYLDAPGAGGAGYGTSAVGLLSRMYLGWKKDHPKLQLGVSRLAKQGPTKDLYYDYYATQIMHHMEGEAWVAWNARMRDMLVEGQSRKGHETGSWFDGFTEGHGPKVAGRLYTTALATLILEVYYRHLPLYGQQSVEAEFVE